MVKPLLVANFPEIVGGGEIGLLDLARGLRERGVEPLIAVPGEGSLAEEFPREIIPRSLCGAALALRRLAYRVDLVHTTGARGLVAAALARTRKPLIWHVRVAARDKLDPILVHLPDLVIANSRATAGRFRCGAPVHVIYNGIAETTPAARPLFTDGGRKRIGVIGRMTPEKGHLDLLPVLTDIIERRPDIDIVFAGDDRGEIGSNIIRAASASRGRMSVLGYIPDMARHLHEFALIVIPSRVEGFGRVAAEAIRAGVTVAATRAGGLCEVLEGLDELFLPADRRLWHEKIVSLIDHPPYSEYRLKTAGERFSLAAHVGAIISEYERLLSRGRA